VAGLYIGHRSIKKARLEHKLQARLHPVIEARERQNIEAVLFSSSHSVERLQEYDNPALEAEYFVAQRRATDKEAAGRGPLDLAKYTAALSRVLSLQQFSAATGRTFPSRVQMAALTNTSISASIVQSVNSNATGTGAPESWEWLGPGNVGGRTRALVVDPRNPQILYAAAASGGIWKSKDAGDTWTPIADFLANTAVNSLALDPTNSQVLYAGTGEGYLNIDATRGQGIFKSIDGGTSWRQLASTTTRDFYYVRHLAISPITPARIYAATATGVLRSDDSGEHWTFALPDRNASEAILGCVDLTIQVAEPHYVFATCGTFNPAVILRTVDGSVNGWQEVLKIQDMGRTSIAIAPSSPNVVYALASSLADGNYKHGLLGVYRSTANGDVNSWVRTTDPSSTSETNRVLLSNPIQAFYRECFGQQQDTYLNQGWYDNVIAVDPKDANIVWVGGTDLFRSDDGGRNFGIASYWWFTPGQDATYAHADHHVITFSPDYSGTDKQVMYVANDGGIFLTTNSRASVPHTLAALCGNTPGEVVWKSRNSGYGVTQFYSGAVVQGSNVYFGGTQDNGTVSSSGGGPNTWQTMLGGDGGFVAVDKSDPTVLYAAYTGPSIQKSTDGGKSFHQSSEGLCACGAACADSHPCNNFLFIMPFALDPSNNQFMWSGGDQIFRSDDGAGSWHPASTKFDAAAFPPVASGLLSAIAVSPHNTNVVIAGFAPTRTTGGGWIHRTTVGRTASAATVWSRTRPRAGWVSDIVFDPNKAQVVYATYSSFNSDDGADVGHVFRSMDSGVTWTRIDGTGAQTLPDIPVHCLVVDPTSSSHLYIGTDLGIFASLDAGATWKVESSAFPNVVVQKLLFDSETPRRLYAFTHGRGVWRVSTH
jgi:hypothetical protein